MRKSLAVRNMVPMTVLSMRELRGLAPLVIGRYLQERGTGAGAIAM